MSIRDDADKIIKDSIEAVLPDSAVKKALLDLPVCDGKIVLVAIGKAAWQMTRAAKDALGDRISEGICITKYDHVKGDIEGIRCYEAGHPVLDENSVKATIEAERLVENLGEKDLCLFLISGGGSALFEDPLVPLIEIQDINRQLLASGADIKEINTIRKRLSKVKGGRFGKLCKPAKVFSVVLSDIIGDPLDMIASGPAYPDESTSDDALNIINKYELKFSDEAMKLIMQETPKTLTNVETHITGSVRQLCDAAAKACKDLGYEPEIITTELNTEARKAGEELSNLARLHTSDGGKLAFIMGGETVVKLTGKGLGGRNQEIALSAADGISGLENTCVFSLGSDGTDGPTDAAGGIVDGKTKEKLEGQGISISDILSDNDAYHALLKCDGLIKTGPTGTNVNDVSVLLINK